MIIRLFLAVLLLAQSAYAADRIMGTTTGSGVLQELTGAQASAIIGASSVITVGTDLPSTCTPGGEDAFFLDTDTDTLYYCSDTDTYLGVSQGQTITLDNAFDNGKEINGANSLANAVRLGDGTTPICIFTDVTIGPVIKPCTDANTRTHIWTNFTWGIRDHEGDADMFIVDPDAATKKAMYAFQSGYYPLKSFYLPAGYFSTDGTQCAAPAEATPVASGAKLFTILCADNDSSRMHATFDMPDDYDGGTIQLKSVVVQTAADTNVIEFQARAQCKGDTETLVAISSFGTEVVWTDTMTGSGAVNKATSGAITPSGTCAAGDLISLSIDIGATNTTTAMATAHILGFKVIYSSTSLSH